MIGPLPTSHENADYFLSIRDSEGVENLTLGVVVEKKIQDQQRYYMRRQREVVNGIMAEDTSECFTEIGQNSNLLGQNGQKQ